MAPEQEAVLAVVQQHIAAGHPLIMTWHSHAVGQSAPGFTFMGVDVHQPVRAIRQASRAEFLEHCHPHDAYLAKNAVAFYEFESD